MAASCECHMFKQAGYCYHTGYKPPPPYEPLMNRVQRGIDKAFDALAEENKPDRMLTKDERKAKANELRQYADDVERG